MSDDTPKRKLKPRDPEKICGAGTPPCQQWKGFKTSHPGVGACNMHGGNLPNHQKAADREQATKRMRTYGVPIDTDPMNALMGEVKRSSGIVAWLEEKIGDGDANSLIQVGEKFGEKPAVLVELYKDERAHLARVCKMALDAGVSQGLLDMVKQQAGAWIEVFNAIIGDPRWAFTEQQKQLAPTIVDDHLEQLLRGKKDGDDAPVS